MARSLKKGPYIHYKLEKKVLDAVAEQEKNRHQDLVTRVDDLSGFRGPDYRRS